ncbi:MAG: hypothetical protein FWD57_14955, partial [Polyangiaceae bacterium]|nr:hypothetical protein [Polyangiaceae bacterium]
MNGKSISSRKAITSLTACLIASACLCTSCGPGGATGGAKTETALGGPRTESICNTSDGEVVSLVVDWSATERASLEAAAARGVVVAKVDGCEMRILSRCKVTGGAYRYQSVPAKPQHETYKDEGKLYADMRFGVARLAGHLSGSSFLDLNMTIVGEYMSDQPDASAARVEGDCAGATHTIVSYNVGAFELRSVDASSAGGSGAALGGDVGGEKASSSRWSTGVGNLGACETGGSDTSPPEKCRSPIGITLVPLVGR